MIVELWSAKQRLDSSFELANTLPRDEEILAHWARYLCVLTSGLIELGVRVVLSEFSRRKAAPEVARFAATRIEWLMNLNTEKIRGAVGSFSPEWRDDFDSIITDEQKDAIDSIVANRNNIVHGRPVGISYAVVKRYYEQSWEVLAWLNEKILEG
jgi:hypothetical protein